MYANVEYAAKNGLFSGTTDTTFEPNGLLTRAMLVTVLWRADGKPQADNEVTFTDVEAGGYYFEAVRWAASIGIVSGHSETEFAPNDNITREQIATIMHSIKDMMYQLEKIQTFFPTQILNTFPNMQSRLCSTR